MIPALTGFNSTYRGQAHRRFWARIKNENLPSDRFGTVGCHFNAPAFPGALLFTVLPLLRSMAVIGTARAAIISDTRLNGLHRVTFEVGSSQVAEVVRRYIMATCTGKTFVCAVFAGHGAVILA